MANSHVGHDCRVGDDVTFANSVALGGHVEIGDGVIFGGLAAVQQFCRVGKGAMVGGLTGVNRDVIPYAMAFGDHVELAGLNLVGLKRRGLSRDTINAMRATFRSVFYGEGGELADRARAARERYRRMWPKWARWWTSSWPTPNRNCAWRAGAERGVSGGTLGLIAGGGELPRAVAHAAARRRARGFCRAAGGQRYGRLGHGFPHEFLSPGEPGRIIKALKAAGAGEVLLAGRVDRPKFNEMKLDAKGDVVAAQGDRGRQQGR